MEDGRSWRAGAAGGESRAALESANCGRIENANQRGRGQIEQVLINAGAQRGRCCARDEWRGAIRWREARDCVE